MSAREEVLAIGRLSRPRRYLIRLSWVLTGDTWITTAELSRPWCLVAVDLVRGLTLVGLVERFVQDGHSASRYRSGMRAKAARQALGHPFLSTQMGTALIPIAFRPPWWRPINRNRWDRTPPRRLITCVPAAEPESFYAIRRTDIEKLFDEYEWIACDGPGDWDVVAGDSDDEPSEYEIVRMVVESVAKRTIEPERDS